jgi:hypothetical protein
MAIFRGGKRIGPFDLRIGLPRGREYDNIPGDPRLQQRANPETTINRFRAAIATGEGVARPTRFLVRVSMPQGGINLAGIIDNEPQSNTDPELARAQKNKSAMAQQNQEIGREIGLMCEAVQMPDRTINTNPYRHYGPTYNVPSIAQYADVTMTFIGDKFLRLRQFFESWQNLIIDNVTNNSGYYDDYTAPIDIFQLGQFDTLNDRDSVTYGIRMFEAYPTSIGTVDYSYGANNEYVKINVTFTYRYWLNFNLDIDSTGKVGGLSSGEVKPGSSGFPFFDKLPPELKRTGRNAFNTLKRSIPIGKVFGGKVFPPFTF